MWPSGRCGGSMGRARSERKRFPEIGSKEPGPEMHVLPVRMDFKYGAAFNAPIRDAYERLILDAIRGDAALFARNDEVEVAWSLISPILDTWRDLSCPIFPNYPAG